MGLSCECGEWDGEGYCYVPNEEFEKFPGTKTGKRKRCRSCGELIEIGALALRFDHFRYANPDDKVESKIFSDDHEIYAAPSWWCEKCGDHYFNLTELGYCVGPHEKVAELLKEYAEEHRRVA